MNELAPERLRQVAEVANRLRSIQMDTSARSSQERQAFMSDVIDRALSGIQPAERRAFLDVLQERFPAWNGQTQPAPAATTAVKGGLAKDAPELRDPLFLVSRLEELAPSLPDEQRKQLTVRLAGAGLAAAGASPAGSVAWPAEEAKALRAKLKLPEQKPLDPARVMALTNMLVELACGLHQLVWTAWRVIAPNTEIRAGGNLQVLLSRFQQADAAVPRDQIAYDLHFLRQLTAAVLAAIGETGRQFARQHQEKFAPEALMQCVRDETGGKKSMMKSWETLYWEKYVELAGSLDGDSLEAEIRETVSKQAEAFMKGMRRWQAAGAVEGSAPPPSKGRPPATAGPPPAPQANA